MRAGLVKLDTELAVKHQRHLDLRQQEHIKEEQRMMQDFDRARAIFQKELAEKERQYGWRAETAFCT